jgi:putative DNA primase/helicase
LNVANGTLDLKAGTLHPHRREDLLTKLTPIRFEPAASAPSWDAFLLGIFDGDTGLIRFVQRAVGYSLSGSTREQVLFLAHGSGANGKSTFLETIREAAGEYAQQAPPEMFLEQRAGTIRNDVARLPGARLVTAVETGEDRRLAEPLVKQLTGGDMVAARHLYRDYFEFGPQCKAWLATNHRPEIRGTDEAIWRRIRLIPFTVTIPEDERDPNLLETLRAELPGILAWAVAGCLDYLQHGLGAPEAVTAATAGYRADMDVIGTFLDECCVLGTHARAKAVDLYQTYITWADAAGERDRLTKKDFGQRLAERGFAKERDMHARWWRGVRIPPESEKA